MASVEGTNMSQSLSAFPKPAAPKAGQSAVERRFHGTVMLALLHLRRAAKSNDIDEGFAAARDLKIISPEREQFVRKCFLLDAQLQADERPDEEINEELIKKLQSCILSLNTADPA